MMTTLPYTRCLDREEGWWGRKKRNRLLLFQSPEGREYLLSVEHVAAWVAERVLPFLVKRPKEGVDEEDQEKPWSLAAQITEVSSQLSEKTSNWRRFELENLHWVKQICVRHCVNVSEAFPDDG